MDILQNLGTLTGWPSLIFFILSVVFGGIYIRGATKSQAAQIARKADQEAIESLQRQVDIQAKQINMQNERIKYLEEALKEVGAHVAPDGKISHVRKGGKEEP